MKCGLTASNPQPGIQNEPPEYPISPLKVMGMVSSQSVPTFGIQDENFEKLIYDEARR